MRSLSKSNYYTYLFTLLLGTLFFAKTALLAEQESPPKFSVLVSVAPIKELVQRIGGEHVDVSIIVPYGASSHSYDPTPQQILNASQSALWFRLGEVFEERLIKTLKRFPQEIQIVDLRTHLPLLALNGKPCCGSGSYDPHIWLSPDMLKLEAATIAEALIAYDPAHRTLYQENLHRLNSALEALDQEILALRDPSEVRTLLTAHAAFGYFCRAYALEQLAIEVEGKEPTAKQLTQLISRARTLKIHSLIAQPQYNPKGAEVIATALDLPIAFIDPYAQDFFHTLLSVAKACF